MRPETKILYAEGSDLAEGIHNLTVIPSRYHQDMPDDDFGVRWTTYLIAPETGTYALGSCRVAGSLWRTAGR